MWTTLNSLITFHWVPSKTICNICYCQILNLCSRVLANIFAKKGDKNHLRTYLRIFLQKKDKIVCVYPNFKDCRLTDLNNMQICFFGILKSLTSNICESQIKKNIFLLRIFLLEGLVKSRPQNSITEVTLIFFHAAKYLTWNWHPCLTLSPFSDGPVEIMNISYLLDVGWISIFQSWECTVK